ncbi:MAG TPA: acylphosphatase [Thermomicrobiales bacterium]|nr:acylphosphatase [Thermomicrobiales bacterium]
MSDDQSSASRFVIRVEGHVQGVNYRASARRMARELGIEAEPVNLDDGSVRITVSGPREAVDRFVEWCRSGPPLAEVSSVSVEEPV